MALDSTRSERERMLMYSVRANLMHPHKTSRHDAGSFSGIDARDAKPVRSTIRFASSVSMSKSPLKRQRRRNRCCPEFRSTPGESFDRTPRIVSEDVLNLSVPAYQ
ncbi:MAG: hypothetical protein KA144_09160 [Xanthomonadaceae bacterium]|nr:hypothetical protein [Xanthomonadaceae bacterium]